jgi:SpoIID/LytB domain protein
MSPAPQRERLAQCAAVALLCLFAAGARAQAPAGIAFFTRSLENPRDRREARPEVLDTPVLPGSIVKTIALVAALERGVVTANTSHMCRRTLQADGQTLTCSHPDLKRPLSPAEALAYSCNDFFVSLAPKLSRAALNATRLAAGLPPIQSGTAMASAIVGLAGPRTTPRALLDVMARVVGAGRDTAVPMKPATRAVLLDGLRGAAEYGTASAFRSAKMSALAKTGTILMPNGASLGLVVALTSADTPSRAIVVAAPGAAGLDAAGIAAAELGGRDSLLGSHPNGWASANSATASAGSQSKPNGPDPLIRLGRTTAEGGTKVETIALDAYIAQVLAGEGQSKAGDAAQQALAITARTFALANRNRHRKEGFDLCDTTHCQVVRPATTITRRAAEATSGRVLMHRGQLALVFYSAWCGGKSELASQVWPGATDYAPPARHDDACEGEPAWTSEVRAGDIERALRGAGLHGSRLTNLRILTRNTSERVARIAVDGFTPAEISGHEFRMAVGRVAGWQAIKSTSFEIDRTSTGYRFRGVGFGHGVGLCVVGAGRRATKGATADDILRFYFPGLTIGRVGSNTLTSTFPPMPSPPAMLPPFAKAALPATTDVALALPGAEEGERQALLALIRRSRDEVANATGVAPPPQLRITVHPNVESFGRATGQPWWVSGATEGAAIELLPVTVLRQQGQLERTIRHEMAHALLDSALVQRPMWVREGAAAYYARPASARVTPADRVTCPSDNEFLRALSAGAQRDAYARAEACFARSISEGRRWDQVR